MKAPRLLAELHLAESELRSRFGLGPSHETCANHSLSLLGRLAEVEDPDFLQSLHASHGLHLEALDRDEEAIVAFQQAFELLRKVAARFTSKHAHWKSAYLSSENRAGVVRRVAQWSQKKTHPDH